MSFQGLSVAIGTMRIVKELMEIWPNEVCDKQILWPESERKEIEVQGSTKKGKQREQRLNGVEKEGKFERQKEENAIEGVEEESSGLSPVAYSVRTGAR